MNKPPPKKLKPSEKRYPQLFEFRWGIDKRGYSLSADGTKVVRLGGALEPYAPAQKQSPHLALASLRWGTDADSRGQAALGFVREYGFLGSDAYGADAKSEDVDYVIATAVELVMFVGLPNDPAGGVMVDRSDGKAYAQEFNRNAPVARVQLVADTRNQFRLEVRPTTLLAWIWLRVAEDCLQHIRYDLPPCLLCGRPIARGAGAKRMHSRFCNDTHKKQFSRLTDQEQKARAAKYAPTKKRERKS